MPDFHRQPLKGLYLTYELVTTLFVRIPFWTLTSIPRCVFFTELECRKLLWDEYLYRNLSKVTASQNDMDNKVIGHAQVH
jgi:hypothetical protein